MVEKLLVQDGHGNASGCGGPSTLWPSTTAPCVASIRKMSAWCARTSAAVASCRVAFLKAKRNARFQILGCSFQDLANSSRSKPTVGTL